MSSFGIYAIVRLVSHFAFIYLAFWALQSLRLDHLFKKGHTQQIQVLYLLLATAIGFITSSFFLDVIQLVKNIFLKV